MLEAVVVLMRNESEGGSENFTKWYRRDDDELATDRRPNLDDHGPT
jgi:hypothetical protein